MQDAWGDYFDALLKSFELRTFPRSEQGFRMEAETSFLAFLKKKTIYTHK